MSHLTGTGKTCALRDGHSGQHRSRTRAQTVAEQLRRGEHVLHDGNHHAGMRLLLAETSGKCPLGYTLSLINPRSASAYIGFDHKRGGPYVLSTDPNDYAWESRARNIMRGHPTTDADLMAELLCRGIA